MKKIILSTILSLIFYQAFGQCIPSITNDCFAVPDYVDSVVVTNAVVNFSNQQTNCNGQDFNYGFYNSFTATAEVGGSFDLHVGLNNSVPSQMGVWIDWNDDLVFSTTEEIYLSTGAITTANLTIPVPLTAVLDTVLMRIRSASTLIDACNSANAGETEDYNLLLVTPTNVQNFPNSVLSWSLFPNPAAEKINVNINNFNTNLEYALTDILGNIVANDKITNDRFTINTSQLPRGVYFLSLNQNGNKHVKKILLH